MASSSPGRNKLAMAYQEQNEKIRNESPQFEAVHQEHMSVATYLATRIPTLKPPMVKAPNPIELVRLLNLQQWLFFLVAFFAWTWDAFDFFTVSLTVEQLAEEFDKKPSQITWGITLVLSKLPAAVGLNGC